MLLHTKYEINIKKIMVILLIILLILIILHVISMQICFNQDLGIKEKYHLKYWHLSIFDLDKEESFGTYYNSILLFLAGILILFKMNLLNSDELKWKKWWLVSGYGLCLLSIEEIVGIHELINTISDIPWTIYVLPVLVIVGIAYIPFICYYRGKTGYLLMISALVYFTGALGVEHLSSTKVNTLQYNMVSTLEEGMEILGVILLIYTILSDLRARKINCLQIDLEIK